MPGVNHTQFSSQSRRCGNGSRPHMNQQDRPKGYVRYLDELHVGQRFESGTRTVTEADIKAFAVAYDPQPFHLDDEAAKSTLFRGLAASGWHTAAATMSLLVDAGLPLADGIIGAGAEIKWPRPLRPGDVVR